MLRNITIPFGYYTTYMEDFVIYTIKLRYKDMPSVYTYALKYSKYPLKVHRYSHNNKIWIRITFMTTHFKEYYEVQDFLIKFLGKPNKYKDV